MVARLTQQTLLPLNEKHMKTIVFQSYRPDQKVEWIEACLASVEGWATACGFDYQFLGDELFDVLPKKVLEKYENQPVVRSDLARILIARSYLEGGYMRVIWADADFLIFSPAIFRLDEDPPYAFGKEVWVQKDGAGRLRSFGKIHNAFFQFSIGNAFLDYYIHAAEKLLSRAIAPVVPQFIGPKFLTSQHNLIGFDEITEAAMFSPLVLQDILNGGGEALALMKSEHDNEICGANLCLSQIGRPADGVSHDNDDALRAVKHLLDGGTDFLVT
jgi:hypothetical protein